MGTSAGFSYGGIDVLSPGVTRGSVLSKITPRMNRGANTAPVAAIDAPEGGMAGMGGSPVGVIIALIGILFLLSYFGHRNGGTVFGINLFTFAFFIVLTVVGIAGLKLLVSAYPIPGLTQVVAIV